MKGLVCTKVGMMQVWDESNTLLPVTVLKVMDSHITNFRTKEKNNYDAIQVGYSPLPDKKINKPNKGQQKDSYEKLHKYFKYTMEFPDFPHSDKQIGDVITPDIFSASDKVCVQGITKGKGFQGVVKRYGFHGGRKTHGSHFHRKPGAIGACADPARVAKGKKMPGHMGMRKKTVSNLKIHSINMEEKIIFVKGAVPGNKGNTVLVYQK